MSEESKIKKKQLAELEQRQARIREMGGHERVEEQKKKGKLTARERIDTLLDKGTFREIGMFAGSRGAAMQVPADAVIKSAPSSSVVSPEIVTVPFKSIAVAVKSISSVAPKDRTVALDPCINWLASLNIILFVLFNVSPDSSV